MPVNTCVRRHSQTLTPWQPHRCIICTSRQDVHQTFQRTPNAWDFSKNLLVLMSSFLRCMCTNTDMTALPRTDEGCTFRIWILCNTLSHQPFAPWHINLLSLNISALSRIEDSTRHTFGVVHQHQATSTFSTVIHHHKRFHKKTN